uniref:Microtubule-associated protein n=1 Tax=Steinernema glaseri TaxID=37863 RepID=A0A1I7Y760_9BILA
MGDSAQRNRRDFASEVARRREAAEREQEQRRESILREREERQQRLEKRREEERREKERRNQEREFRRQKVILDRRYAQLEKEEARKQAILAKTHAKASRVAAVQRPKPIYAFGSSTPRELSFLERLPAEQKIYDRRLTPTCGPTPPPASPVTTPVRRRGDMSRSMYHGPNRNRTATANSTLCVASATRSAPHPPSSMTQSMYVASKTLSATPKARPSRRAPPPPVVTVKSSPKPPIPTSARSRRSEQSSPSKSPPAEVKKPPPIRPPKAFLEKKAEESEQKETTPERPPQEQMSPEPEMVASPIPVVEVTSEEPLEEEQNLINFEKERENEPSEEGEIPPVVSIIDEVLESEAAEAPLPKEPVEDHSEQPMEVDVEVVSSERMATSDSSEAATPDSEPEEPKTEPILSKKDEVFQNGEVTVVVEKTFEGSGSESGAAECASATRVAESMSASVSASDLTNSNEKMTASVSAVSLQLEKERQERAQRMARVNELLAKTRNGSKLTTAFSNGNGAPVTEESKQTPVNGETTTTVENQQNGFASAKAPTPPLILNQKPILDGISLSSSTARALQKLQLMRNGGAGATPPKKEPVSLADELTQLNVMLPGTPDHYPPEDPHVRAVTQS